LIVTIDDRDVPHESAFVQRVLDLGEVDAMAGDLDHRVSAPEVHEAAA
jgi:hypothetical protein